MLFIIYVRFKNIEAKKSCKQVRAKEKINRQFQLLVYACRG
jgi:hypothetical protein